MSGFLGFDETLNHLYRNHNNSITEISQDNQTPHPLAVAQFVKCLLVTDVAERSLRGLVSWTCVLQEVFSEAAQVLQSLEGSGVVYGGTHAGSMGIEDE